MLFCGACCLLSHAASAQKRWWGKVVQDTSYIQSYYNHWCITASGTANNALLNFISLRSGNRATYQTDIPISGGLSIDYKWFTLGFNSNLTYINLYTEGAEKGISTHRSLQAGITGKRLWLQSSLQEYDGFYLIDVRSNNGYQLPRVESRSDVQVRAFFSSVQYVFNPHRYSHVATLWQLDRQIRSAGTPTVGLLVNYYTTSADSSLAPRAIRFAFPRRQQGFRRSFINAFVTAGYTYTFALPHSCFLNVGSWIGLGIQRISNDPSPDDMAISLENNLTLGYNGKRMYSGLQLNGKAFVDNILSGEPYNHIFGQARIFVGYRLPKKNLNR